MSLPPEVWPITMYTQGDGEHMLTEIACVPVQGTTAPARVHLGREHARVYGAVGVPGEVDPMEVDSADSAFALSDAFATIGHAIRDDETTNLRGRFAS